MRSVRREKRLPQSCSQSPLWVCTLVLLVYHLERKSGMEFEVYASPRSICKQARRRKWRDVVYALSSKSFPLNTRQGKGKEKGRHILQKAETRGAHGARLSEFTHNPLGLKCVWCVPNRLCHSLTILDCVAHCRILWA